MTTGVDADIAAMMEALGTSRRDETYLNVDADARGRMQHTSDAELVRRQQVARTRREHGINAGDAQTRAWNRMISLIRFVTKELLLTFCRAR